MSKKELMPQSQMPQFQMTFSLRVMNKKSRLAVNESRDQDSRNTTQIMMFLSGVLGCGAGVLLNGPML
ncbi:AT hook motif family protein [Zea mays]|uniref:AT hook motif family protein n=1 Tax=Zea mays TaxID=4577 RepID=A0A1D6JEY4_MAIZE|nr:AT hook motif family protein [Zea mays]